MFMSTQFAKEMAYLEQGINPLGFTKARQEIVTFAKQCPYLLFSVKITTF